MQKKIFKSAEFCCHKFVCRKPVEVVPLCSYRSVADELIADIFGSSDEEEEFAVSSSFFSFFSSPGCCFCIEDGDNAESFLPSALPARSLICKGFRTIKKKKEKKKASFLC